MPLQVDFQHSYQQQSLDVCFDYSKAGCCESSLGGQPSQLQLQLYYRVEKVNVDADALSRVSWLICMPGDSGTQHQITAVVVQAMQEATLKGPKSPIEAYSCHLHVMDPVEDGLQVACMTVKDWQQVKLADLILGQVIVKMEDRTMCQYQYEPTDSPELWQLLWESNYLKLRQGILYRKVLLKGSQEGLF